MKKAKISPEGAQNKGIPLILVFFIEKKSFFYRVDYLEPIIKHLIHLKNKKTNLMKRKKIELKKKNIYLKKIKKGILVINRKMIVKKIYQN